ncbi:MAG: hypothetical protein ACRYGR_07260 [Janthinobacterium lividum]
MIYHLQASGTQLEESCDKSSHFLKRTYSFLNLSDESKTNQNIVHKKRRLDASVVTLCDPLSTSSILSTSLQLPSEIWIHSLEYLKDDIKSLVKFGQTARHHQSYASTMLKNNSWSQIKWFEGPELGTLLNYSWNINFEKGLNLALILYQNYHHELSYMSEQMIQKQGSDLLEIATVLNRLYFHLYKIKNPDKKSLAANFLESICLHVTDDFDLEFSKKLYLQGRNFNNETEHQLLTLGLYLKNDRPIIDFEFENEFNLNSLTWLNRFMRFEMWKIKTLDFTFFVDIDFKKIWFELDQCNFGIPKYAYERIIQYFFHQSLDSNNQKLALNVQDAILKRSDVEVKDFVIALDLNIKAKQYARVIELSQLKFLGSIQILKNKSFVIDPDEKFGKSYEVELPHHFGNMIFYSFISNSYLNLSTMINIIPITLRRTKTTMLQIDKTTCHQLVKTISPECGLNTIRRISQMSYEQLCYPEQQNILYFNLLKKMYDAFQYKIENKNY